MLTFGHAENCIILIICYKPCNNNYNYNWSQTLTGLHIFRLLMQCSWDDHSSRILQSAQGVQCPTLQNHGVFRIFKGQWVQWLLKMSTVSQTAFTNMVHVFPNTTDSTHHHLLMHAMSYIMHIWEWPWRLVFRRWKHNFVHCTFGTNQIAALGNCLRQWSKKKNVLQASIIHYTVNFFLPLWHKTI